jgi:hypothetical protein
MKRIDKLEAALKEIALSLSFAAWGRMNNLFTQSLH